MNGVEKIAHAEAGPTLTRLCQGREGVKGVSILAQTVHFRALIAGLLALVVAPAAFAADPRRDEQWGLEMVKAEIAWRTSTGVGAVVAVIDTGVQRDHPDLDDRLLTGFDFVGDDPVEEGDEDDDPTDGNGHGTHVTGIVAANRDNDEGITGVAPGARVLPLRVLDDDGAGYADDTIKAVDRAIDSGVHVINLSLGDFLPLQSTLFDDPDYRAVLQRAVGAGIVVVIAAGNNGLPKCENPNVEGIVCVGAVDNTRARSAFSSFGSNVDLMAPGGSGLGGSAEDVLSTYTGSGYESISGTSQAAPHVAGVAALLVSLGMTGEEAAGRIAATAADAGAPGPDGTYGAGIVDAAAAVAGLGVPPTDPGDPNPAHGSFDTKTEVSRRAVRRRGFRVKCLAVRPGTCAVVVRRRGRKIARGRADVPAEIGTVVRAELNRRGRRVVKKMGERLRVRIAVTLPGETVRTRRIRVER
jgi:subtilisin family serine protease